MLSQNKDKFDQFLLSFEELISDRMSQNPHFIYVTGELTVRLSSWWKNNPATSEGNQVEAITSSCGLSQFICEPVHILQNLSL